jgi:hypothetical protein
MPDPWAVVSHTPAAPPGADPWAVVAHTSATEEEPYTPFTPVRQLAHFGGRIVHALGIPTSMDEARAMEKAEESLPLWQRALPHAPGSSPTPLQSVAGIAGTGGAQLALTAPVVVSNVKKAIAEHQAATEAGIQGHYGAAAAHLAGVPGYAGAALLAPVFGEAPVKAGEALGAGQYEEAGAQTTAIAAPFALGELGGGNVPRGTLKAATEPAHIEALTGFLKTTKTDPYVTATTVLPEARAVAAREGINPAAFEGRKGGELITGKNGVFHKAIQEHSAEYDALKTKAGNPPLDTTPIAQAYLDKITPEMEANAPQIANRLRAEASKFATLAEDDQGNITSQITGVKPQPLLQVDDFRERLNNELNTEYQKSPDARMRAGVEVKADEAARDAAAELSYQTISKNTGTSVDEIRALQQRRGALIEARRDLTTAFNDASGAQGERVAGSIRTNPPFSGRFATTLGEKATHLYPSRHGAMRVGLREVGPKPLSLFNRDLKLMFDKLGPAEAKPAPVPERGTFMRDPRTGEQIIGGELPPTRPSFTSTVAGEHRAVAPASTPPVKPPYSTNADLTPAQKATAWLLAAKRGDVSQQEADKRIQRLVGSGGRKIKRPVGGGE